MRIRILAIILFACSAYLLISVDWRIFLGVMIFGWAMNIENKEEKV